MIANNSVSTTENIAFDRTSFFFVSLETMLYDIEKALKLFQYSSSLADG